MGNPWRCTYVRPLKEQELRLLSYNGPTNCYTCWNILGCSGNILGSGKPRAACRREHFSKVPQQEVYVSENMKYEEYAPPITLPEMQAGKYQMLRIKDASIALENREVVAPSIGIKTVKEVGTFLPFPGFSSSGQGNALLSATQTIAHS